MKVLLSWLREFAPFEGEPEALGDELSDLGLAVEEMTRVGEGLDGVLVARIVDIRTIEGADKIRVVDVDAGDGDTRQIVCGAWNIAVGDTVPLATIGTVLPGGFEIGKRKMRGIESHGMLCSPKELGFGADHAGILQLDGTTEPGTPLREALGIQPDVLFDLEVNANRPDAMSVAGVARDLAARMRLPFTLPSPVVQRVGAPASGATTVELVDADLCGRFQSRVLRNVRVGSSPQWMANRLTQLGMRPINALVDISNYVMLELGQPNHPYDLALVPGGGFRVRRATAGEQLTTLDDVVRTFTADDLLICGADDTPIGIAGVRGGAACEISEATTEVLLEMAWFMPMSISRTSRRLGLRTEASARFERGCDPEVIDLAADRFCQLAAEICGAATAPDDVDVRGQLPDRSPIRVRTARVNKILGTDLDGQTIADHLSSIGFEVTASGADHEVVVPSWRYDTTIEIEVIEEVARLHGYANIVPRRLPSARTGRLEVRQAERRALRRALMGLGLAEAMPMPFLAPGELARCGLPDDGIRLLNPLVADESVLRTSLLPGLVQGIAYNVARRQPGVGLFEIGHVFRSPPEGQLLPDERECLAAIRSGLEATAAVETWSILADALGISDGVIVNNAVPGLHPTRSGQVVVGGTVVGELGEIDPEVLAAHAIDERVAWLQLDLTVLLALPHGERAYRLVSRFPSSDIDLAFEVPDQVPAHEVEATLRTSAGDLLATLALFDVFRGPPVGEGRRSLAFSLRLQAPDRTLTDDDVQAVRQAAIAAVEAAHPGATLR